MNAGHANVQVFQKKKDGMGPYWAIGHITREIKATMINFLKIDFVHEPREANKEAHKLARSAI